MKNIYAKLFEAKKFVASLEIKKQGENSYSNYNYFTPEQVASIVQKACEHSNLLTLFHLKRNELWEYGVLEIIDTESGEKVELEASTAIPQIKATNVAQQIWGCMTYTERYLKMTAFGIADNSLDFDTTENTQKRVKEAKTDQGVSKPWFNEPEFKNFEKRKTEYETWEIAVAFIKKHYQLSNPMETKILSLYANN